MDYKQKGELPKVGKVQILHVANSDKLVEFYNLDVIISDACPQYLPITEHLKQCAEILES